MIDILILYWQVGSDNVHLSQRANQRLLASAALSECNQLANDIQLGNYTEQELYIGLDILCQRITLNGLNVGFDNCVGMLFKFKEMLITQGLSRMLRIKLSQIIAILLCLITTKQPTFMKKQLEQILQARKDDLIIRLPLLSFIPKKLVQSNLRSTNKLQIKEILMGYEQGVVVLFQNLLSAGLSQQQVLTGIENWAECFCIRFMRYPSIINALLSLKQLPTLDKIVKTMAQSKVIDMSHEYINLNELEQQMPVIITIIEYIHSHRKDFMDTIKDSILQYQNTQSFLNIIATLLSQIPDLVREPLGYNLLEYFIIIFNNKSLSASSITFQFWAAFIHKIQFLSISKELSNNLQKIMISLFQVYSSRIQLTSQELFSENSGVNVKKKKRMNMIEYRQVSEQFLTSLIDYFSQYNILQIVFEGLNAILQQTEQFSAQFLQKQIYILKVMLDSVLPIDLIEDCQICPISELINTLMDTFYADSGALPQMMIINFCKVLISIAGCEDLQETPVDSIKMIYFSLHFLESEDELIAGQAALLFQWLDKILNTHGNPQIIWDCLERYHRCNNLTAERKQNILKNIMACIKQTNFGQQQAILVALFHKMSTEITQFKFEEFDYRSIHEDKRLYFRDQIKTILDIIITDKAKSERFFNQALELNKNCIEFVTKALNFLTQRYYIRISNQKIDFFSFLLKDTIIFSQNHRNILQHEYLEALTSIISFVFNRDVRENNFHKYEIFIDNIQAIQNQVKDLQDNQLYGWAAHNIHRMREFTDTLIKKDTVDPSCLTFFLVVHNILFRHNPEQYLKIYQDTVLKFLLNNATIAETTHLKEYLNQLSDSPLLQAFVPQKHNYIVALILTMKYRDSYRLNTALEKYFQGSAQGLILKQLHEFFPIPDPEVEFILQQLQAALLNRNQLPAASCLTKLKGKMLAWREIKEREHEKALFNAARGKPKQEEQEKEQYLS